MKKLTALFLGLILVSALAACTGGQNETTTAGGTTVNGETAQAQTDENKTTADKTTADTTAKDTSKSGKVLVVYYSASGYTKQAAEYVAQAADGDLFEIVPKEVYTSDDLNWTNSNSRVSTEHNNPDQREVELVSTRVDNWDEYDTVFIGYPIWWGIAAWPVDGFVKANDFSGKTVIPFCTSTSSGLGESGELLKEIAGTGDWQDGMRFRSAVSQSDVTEWVNSLGL